MCERMTWYRYVTHNAPSFDAPNMTVYAVFNLNNETI
jgi:hypothetical protein